MSRKKYVIRLPEKIFSRLTDPKLMQGHPREALFLYIYFLFALLRDGDEGSLALEGNWADLAGGLAAKLCLEHENVDGGLRALVASGLMENEVTRLRIPAYREHLGTEDGAKTKEGGKRKGPGSGENAAREEACAIWELERGVRKREEELERRQARLEEREEALAAREERCRCILFEAALYTGENEEEEER